MNVTKQGWRIRGEGLILADQLTLYQPWGANYTHHITTPPPQIFRPSPIPAKDYSTTVLVLYDLTMYVRI